MTPLQAKLFAASFLEAAPEDAGSVDEYDWALRWLTKKDLEDTGLGTNFAEHARDISLDPAKSDLARPVVVSIGDGELNRIAVWDGVHRIMSALAIGCDLLPAVVGTRIATPTPTSAAQSGASRELNEPVASDPLATQRNRPRH